MSTNLIVALVLYLCPDPNAMDKRYNVQGEQATCAEYYTNEIVNNPSKYEKMKRYVKPE